MFGASWQAWEALRGNSLGLSLDRFIGTVLQCFKSELSSRTLWDAVAIAWRSHNHCIFYSPFLVCSCINIGVFLRSLLILFDILPHPSFCHTCFFFWNSSSTWILEFSCTKWSITSDNDILLSYLLLRIFIVPDFCCFAQKMFVFIVVLWSFHLLAITMSRFSD